MAFDVTDGDKFTARLIHHGPGYDTYEGDLAFDVINADGTTVATVDDTNPGAGVDDASNYNESITIDPDNNGYSGGTERWYLKVYAPDSPVDEDCPNGGSGSCDGEFEIQFSNEPSASISEDDTDDTLVEGTDTITFDASGSSDPDGDISEYRWDFDGDGSTDETTSSATTDHTYSISDSSYKGGSASFTPKVTVADSAGGTDTATLGHSLTIRNDLDGDGTADINDNDADGDGVSNTIDPDDLDTDTDGDGISDDVEMTPPGGGSYQEVDTDGDGDIDADDTDSDNDGTSDGTDGTGDADSDGYADYRDDAPVFTGGDSLTTIHEDADPSGETVDSAIGGNFDDSTGGGANSFHGILITDDASTSGEGTWEYSKDSGSTWFSVGSVSTSSALFVHKDDHLRFNPAADFDGTPGSLTVHAVDSAESFATEDKKDVSTFGRLSGVSNAGGESLDITVRDAPEVSSIDRATGDGNPTSASSVDFDVTFTDSVKSADVDTSDFTTTQVSGDVSGSISGVSGSGSSYTVTVDSITGDGDLRLDLDDDGSITGTSNGVELGGVLTTGAGDGSHVGDESFTVDNTSPSLTADSGSTDEDSSATIESDLTSNDNDDTSLTVTKVDGNGGNVGSATAGSNDGQFTIASDGTVDFDPNSDFESLGGSETDTTKIQATVEDAVGNADTQTVTATVTGVNDAPTMSSDTRTLADIDEDAADNSGTTASTLLSSAGTTSDVEGDTLGVAVTGVDNTDGTWEYSTDGGNTWTGFSSPSASSARLLADDDHVRFVPNDDFSGSAAGSVTVRAWDQTGGSAGTTADTTSTGGSTPYASTTTDADVTVRDAPEVTSITRNTSPNPTKADVVAFTVRFGESVSGVDTADFTATRVNDTVEGTVDSVNKSSGTAFNVTVNEISGSGSLRLDLLDDDTITNGNGVALGGDGTSGVADGGYTNGENFTVYQPASDPMFDVGSLTHAETVSAGEELTVEAEIENEGDEQDTQNITFSLAGNQHDLTSLSLDGGESQTVEFSYPTALDDVGDRTGEIASDDDRRSFTVTVEEGGPSALGITLGAESVFVDQQTTATVRATLVDGSTEIVTENATLGIDNDTVATVNDGTVTARAEGTTTLTAEYRGVSTSTTLEVTEGTVSARASASTYTPRLGEDGKTAPVRLRATESTVSGADPSFVWRWEANGTEHTATGKRHSTTFGEPGPVTVELEVTAGGATDTELVNLTVQDTTVPDTELSVPDTVAVGEQFTFDATDSIDNAGIARYEWDFDNGTTAAGPSLDSPTGAYADPGVYTVTVRNTDTSGNQATETATVVVEGPEAVVSGLDAEFDTVGTTSMASRSIVVENAGTLPLDVTSANVSGDDASAFGVSGDDVSIRPGETRSLAVTFDPSEAGDHAAVVRIETNSTGQKTFEGALQGVGVESSLEPANSAVAFGDLRVGDRQERDVMIANRGDEDAAITDVTVDAPHFTVVNAPERIEAGTSERVTVAFAPDAASSRTATLQVDAGTDTARVSLAGTGVGPAMTLSTDSLEFETAGVGTSATGEVAVKNYGSRTLAVESVSVAGGDAAAFTIVDEPSTIAPGASGSLEVQFSPGQPGTHDATLEIDGNDPAGAQTVDVSGSAAGADIVVDRTTVDFGQTEIGQSYVEAVTVRNAGPADTRLTVEDLQTTGSHAGAFTIDHPDEPFVLAPGEEREVAINFTTQVGDARQAQLQIHSDAANHPQVNVWLSNTRGYIAVQEVSNPTVNVEGVNLPAGSRHLVNVSTPSTQASPVTVDELEMTTNNSHFEMNLSNAPKPFDNALETGEDTSVLQYVELDHIEGDAAETFDDTGVHYRVDAAAVPEGVAPEEVAIRRYDESTGEWRELDAALVRRTSGEFVYEVATPGFSEFVVTAPQTGPDVTVSDASLAAATVPVGESAQATVTLQNRGGATAEHTVELTADGDTVATRTVTVPAGEATTSTLAFTPQEAGTYELAVSSATVGSLTVAADGDDESAASAAEAVNEGGSGEATDEDSTGGAGGPWLLVAGLLVGLLLVSAFVLRRRRGDSR